MSMATPAPWALLLAAAPLKGVIDALGSMVPLVGTCGCPSEMTETMTTDDGVGLDIMTLVIIALLVIMAVVMEETMGMVVVMVVDAIGVVVIIGVVDAGAAEVGA